MKEKPLIFDTANIWEPVTLENKGFRYLNIGSGRKVGGLE